MLWAASGMSASARAMLRSHRIYARPSASGHSICRGFPKPQGLPASRTRSTPTRLMDRHASLGVSMVLRRSAQARARCSHRPHSRSSSIQGADATIMIMEDDGRRIALRIRCRRHAVSRPTARPSWRPSSAPRPSICSGSSVALPRCFFRPSIFSRAAVTRDHCRRCTRARPVPLWPPARPDLLRAARQRALSVGYDASRPETPYVRFEAGSASRRRQKILLEIYSRA